MTKFDLAEVSQRNKLKGNVKTVEAILVEPQIVLTQI